LLTFSPAGYPLLDGRRLDSPTDVLHYAYMLSLYEQTHSV
jgi:hypothetical protein